MYKISWLIRALLYKSFFFEIGFLSYLGKPKYIYGFRKINIGSRVRIMPGLRFEVHGDGKLVISDNCSIGNDLHVAAGGHLIISSGALISSCVLITDIDHNYTQFGVPVFDQEVKINKTFIGRNVFIGAGAKILAGTFVGDGCVIGANAVVRGHFPAGSVIVGAPARVHKSYDLVKKQWH
ncbi:acyltransferase [Pusillimonas sp. 7-48]|uniref:Acyltransferase n=1 Tax=Pusillimonas minor TaxID=2697024 RepID=A0A842HNP4_9BURK|nr:acyltransferase [Pusillimonas minor]